jgi:hypothetical protein
MAPQGVADEPGCPKPTVAKFVKNGEATINAVANVDRAETTLKYSTSLLVSWPMSSDMLAMAGTSSGMGKSQSGK